MAEQIKSLKTGIKYKDTPIGKIPVDWEIIRLADVCDEIYRYPTYYNIQYVDQKNGVPEIRGELINKDGTLSSDMSQYRYISKDTSSKYPRTILQEGDFVLSVRGTMGKIGYVSRNLSGSNMTANLMRIAPNRDKIYSAWLKQVLLHDLFQSELNSAASATTIKTIKSFELKSIKLALPSLIEQKKIAEILSTVDEAIEKTDQIIEKTKEAKKGLMQRLLSHGIGHKKFKKTEIGSMPLEWEVVKLGEICDVLDNKRIPLNKDQRSRMAGNIPYYGANGVVDYINDHIFDDELILMAEDGGYFDEYKHRPIAYIVKGKCWVNNHAHILKVKAPNSTLWVYYSVVHKNIIPFIKGGTRAKLNQEDLKKILIPLPDLSEQQKMANNFSDIDTEIEKESNYKIQVQSVKNGLMQLLLTGIIRVKT